MPGTMDPVTVLPRGRPFTVDDLDAIPDDGNRYELLDGMLLVTPSPSRGHQFASSRLQRLLDGACPDDLLVISAPMDVRYGTDTSLQPDLLVVPREGFADQQRPLRPLLVVEILSPSTRLVDLGLKKARYELAACPTYGVVDPITPAITVWELVDGTYVETTRATGRDALSVERPYSLSIVPEDLVL